MKSKSTWGLYEQLRPSQIEAIIEQHPVAYLPWGALEYHGHHNPVGLDSMKAQSLCIDLAKQIGGIVLPVVQIAANLIKSYPGLNFKDHSIEFSENLVKKVCEEYLEQLADQSFKVIVVLSGHAGEPHLQILKQVADDFNQKNPAKFCLVTTEYEVLPDNLLTANHSAHGETSLQLYYAPNTVDLNALPKGRVANLEQDAVSGSDPNLASAADGAVIVKSFLSNTKKLLQPTIEKYTK